MKEPVNATLIMLALLIAAPAPAGEVVPLAAAAAQ